MSLAAHKVLRVFSRREIFFSEASCDGFNRDFCSSGKYMLSLSSDPSSSFLSTSATTFDVEATQSVFSDGRFLVAAT